MLRTNAEILKHFLLTGFNEERNIYKGLVNFNWRIYSLLNDLNFSNKYEAENHYFTYGKNLNLYNYEDLPNDFSVDDYIKCNPELKLLSKADATKHFLKIGREKYNYIKLPVGFNINDYLRLNPDLKTKLSKLSEKEIIDHFIKYGINENRQIYNNKISYKRRILCICHNGNMNVFKKMEKYIYTYTLYVYNN